MKLERSAAIVAVTRLSLIEKIISSDKMVEVKVFRSVYHAIETRIPKKKRMKNAVDSTIAETKSLSEKDVISVHKR